MSLATGARVGPYEIVAPLGAGGMGEVYRARDPKLARDVALKILPHEFWGDSERRLRFEQEAQAASALNHPAVVHIYDIGTSDETLYIAMELVEGRTLRELLASGPLPAKRLLDIAVEIADGLAKAHEAGIIHRDLKPENLMVSKESHVKILDFGLAKLTARSPAEMTGQATVSRHLTRDGLIMGTAGYMSPEQAAGQSIDFRSDQFSFGTVLYEMASAKGPFRRKTNAETLAAILNDQPPPLAQLNAQLPAPLRWIIEERCLAKDPQDRYRSTWDLLSDLRGLRDHFPEVHASGGMGLPRTGRRRVALPLVGTLVVLGLGFGFLTGRRTAGRGPSAAPKFHQLTFGRGSIWSARFGPDGQTILYGAAWEGRPVEPLMTRLGSPESRTLGFPGADLLSVSSSGEMALSLERRYVGGWNYAGILARVSLEGGAPRKVLDGVQWADWSPDGARLAVVREEAGNTRLELPVGTILYETPGWISHPRISPKGDLVAFLDHPSKGDDRGSVAVVDLKGNKRALCGTFGSEQGLAWAPSGSEVWFTASETGAERSLRAVTLSGVQRLLFGAPGILTLQDVSRDGRVLLSRDGLRTGIFGLPPGQTKEQDLSVGDWSIAMDLSRDGKTLSISEQGNAGGVNYSAYLRETNSLSPPVRLGEGAGAISPDGKSLLTISPQAVGPMRLLPTGVGEAKILPGAQLEYQLGVAWFPDGKRVLVEGNEPGRAIRAYVQTLADGSIHPISPPGVEFPFGTHPLSPDAAFVAAIGPDRQAYLYPVEGGDPRPLRGVEATEVPIAWTADGQSVYVFRRGALPCRVYRVDVATGRRDLWKEIAPIDAAGMVAVPRVLMTPDGKSYVYNFRRMLSELYATDPLQ